MIYVGILFGSFVSFGIGYWYGRKRQSAIDSEELDRLQRIVTPPGQPTHKGPANIDEPPSRVTKGRYRANRRMSN